MGDNLQSSRGTDRTYCFIPQELKLSEASIFFKNGIELNVLFSHSFEAGDVCFMIMAGALVFFMIPGLCSHISLTSILSVDLRSNKQLFYILAWSEESPLCPLSGWFLPAMRSVFFSGSSGVTPYHSRRPPQIAS